MSDRVLVPLAIMATLVLGVACGLISGALIAYGCLQPFTVTLGGLSLFRALALIYTGGLPIFGLPDGLRAFAFTNGSLASAPNPVIIVAILATLAWVILNKSPLGEYFMAIGGNPEAARIAGVPVTMTKLAAYMISGLMASAARR